VRQETVNAETIKTAGTTEKEEKMKCSKSSIEQLKTRIDDIRKDSNLKAFEKWREIGELVVRNLENGGHFFKTRQGLFLFDTQNLRTYPLDENMELAATLSARFGINAREHGFQRVLADLQSRATLDGKETEVRRFAHYDEIANRLYISRFDGQMHLLDGTSVRSVDNGTDQVFFFDDSATWEPYRYLPNTAKGELDKHLIESVNFVESSLSVQEQRLLLKLWLMAVFFGNVQPTKIILLLLGDHGAGKTTALRRIQKLLFGPKVNLLSIEKDKQDGFIATITTDPIALFDNLDEQIPWLPYTLSRLATGVTFSRRQLYTTNQKVEFPGVSWLGITARTVRFMENQPDLPDRTLVLKLGRLLDRQPEGELQRAVAQHRDALWSELLDELNHIVGYLRQDSGPVRISFRMADFAALALRVATLWNCRKQVEEAFIKLEGAQADLALEKDPIHQVLEIWLRDEGNHGKALDAGTLHEDWSTIARQHRINWPFGSGRSLGQALNHLQFALKERFEVEVKHDAHSKQNRYGFAPKEPEPHLDSLIRAAEPEEVLEFAGVAGIERGKL
jgi:hypothetical protein